MAVRTVSPSRSALGPGGGGRTGHRPSSPLSPAQEAVLFAQRTAGNQAVTATGPGAMLAVQRGLFDKLRGKPAPPKKTHEKQSAKEMSSAEGANELMRVKEQVQQFLDLRDKLVQKGATPEAAAQMAFSQAPDHVKRYLPLHSGFDVAKREVDKARREEGATKQSQISEGLSKHAQEHGYKMGFGDPMQAKPKDVEKELKEDLAFRRQMERRAERLLLGEREAASLELETAQESGDPAAIAAAKRKLAQLQGEGAVQAKLVQMAMDAKVAIEEKTLQLIEEAKATLGVPRISDAEKWRLREEAKNKVRKDLEGGIDSKLGDAGKALGTVGQVGPTAVKGIGKAAAPLTKGLSAGQKTTFSGVLKSIGLGLKTVGGMFSTAVKLAGRVADRDSDKLDKDANVEIAQDALKLIKQAATAARGSLKVAQTFNSALEKDPGFMAALPGVSIFSGVIGYVGNVISVQPPAERLFSTTAAEAGADAILATALRRTLTENKLQVSTEVVGATANGVRIGTGIAELATAGGLGIPAAIRVGASAMEGAKKAADAVQLEVLRSKTQDARKEGVLQIEGSGQKLIKTDITYAVDTVILAAKKVLAKKASGQPMSPADAKVIAVLGAYGIASGELGRLSLGEIHERMLAKLDQDDEQETVGMKMKAGLESAKETLSELGGGDKDKGYQDLDTYAREQQQQAEREANMTTGDKVKEGFKKAGGYAKKIVTAPLKLKKLGEMASEKSEKVKRLREIKNLTNYKERGDRGKGFVVAEFGADLEKSIAKLRRWIVATQPPDKAALYLKELNTLSEQQKIAKTVGAVDEAEKRSTESVTDRVVSTELAAKGPSLTADQIWTLLGSPGLGKADREYLKYLLTTKKKAS